MWSSVGSVGTVDVADIGKVVFDKSIVQLGHGLAPPQVAEQLARPRPLVSATIRYGVTQEGFGTATNVAGLELWTRFRQGDGRVVATLIEVNVDSGAEATLLTFDTELFGAAGPANFHVGEAGPGEFKRELNFTLCVYYVSVSLTRPDVPFLGIPPAVATLQLVLTGARRR
jgi:hypothetical protein